MWEVTKTTFTLQPAFKGASLEKYTSTYGDVSHDRDNMARLLYTSGSFVSRL